MKLWEVMRLLEENPTDVYEARLNQAWKVRMSVETVFGGYYKFEAFNGKRLIDQSRGAGAFNGNVTLGLDWQLVPQPITLEEAIKAWANGKTISYSYMGYDKRSLFDSNTMMSIEKAENAEWYVED